MTYPNGGENLKGSSSCTITWTASDDYIDNSSVKLEYYDGSSWVVIASGEDNDGSYDWTVPSLDISTAKVRVSVSDLAGNTGSDESDAGFTIDSTNPVVGAISATQFGGPELTPSGSGNAVQGVVNLSVARSNNLSGVAGAPTVTVVDSASSPMAVTYVNESPANTFNYTVTVLSTTANGAATITVSGLADNAGNVAGSSNDTFDINKNQITGSVELQSYVGASRAVTFVATGGASKTWTQTLSFSGGVASFTLTDVPDGTTNLSAKTSWSLRRKVALGGGTDNQWTADLTEFGSYLEKLRSEKVQGWARDTAGRTKQGWKGSGITGAGWGTGMGPGDGSGAGGKGTGKGGGSGYLDPRVRMVVTSYPPTGIERGYTNVPYPDLKIKQHQVTSGGWNVYIQIVPDRYGRIIKRKVLRPETDGPVEKLFVAQVQKEIDRWRFEPAEAKILVDVRFHVE